MDIRNKIEQWSGSTYGEMLESRLYNHRYRPGPEIEMSRKVLENQKLTNKFMTGNSTNDLLKMEKEVGTFKYVSVFNIVSRIRDWCPMDMVYGTCYLAMRDPYVKEKAVQWNMSEEELITKMCGRALRALPSYLREYDLKQQLSERIPDAKFEQSEALDTILHADLKMQKDDETYYFWSFVNTPKSIYNFKSKFFGERQGHVPDGNHITCPFDLNNCADVDGWKLYESLSIGAIVRMIERPSCAEYDQLKQTANQSDIFFKTPKLITKQDDRIIDRYEELSIQR